MSGQKLFRLIAFIMFILAMQNQDLIGEIKAYLQEKEPNEHKLNQILTSGSIGGVFSSQELMTIFNYFLNNYKNHISVNKIGKTYQGKDLNAYFIEGDKNKKSSILFTGVHHAREIVCVNFIVKILLELFYQIENEKHKKEYYEYFNFVFLPIVNLDSFDFITNLYGTTTFEEIKWKRKNMNNSYCSKDSKNVETGVDLNRNYSSHYDYDEQKADECDEIYDGPYAFSEPETQAVRKLVQEHEEITAALNFHTYGNIWLHPYNYMQKPNQYAFNFDPNDKAFYENFKKELKKFIPSIKYGNAIEKIHYYSNGEASDWMYSERKIISFSHELGSPSPNSNNFIIDKKEIPLIMNTNFSAVEHFISKGVPKINHLKYGFTSKNIFFIRFYNEGISHVYNAKVKLSFDNNETANYIKSVVKQSITPNNQILKFNIVDRDILITVDNLSRTTVTEIEINFMEQFVQPLTYEYKIVFESVSGKIFHQQECQYKYFYKTHTHIYNDFKINFMIFLFFLCAAFFVLYTTRCRKTNRQIQKEQQQKLQP